ncbi:hypothetical protein PPYR_12944 [Photinus pyralis]|uniref:COX assembly mitochondrial protein n=1 Tax=Photinus pyralis TaxID=7054 RepID=A0A5N4A7M2_PHOPY|nr:hypothetical protein PPYR_12944 [Photinus pyralis]
MSDTQKHSTNTEKRSLGPYGLGDPEDKTLRKVEIEVCIPKRMREIAHREKCADQVKLFSECCKSNSVLMVVNCRHENSALKECLTRWYHDEAFKRKCTNDYLEERSEYRRTGISKKKTAKLPVSM